MSVATKDAATGIQAPADPAGRIRKRGLVTGVLIMLGSGNGNQPPNSDLALLSNGA
ncbi:hypothetical protein [Catellatospora sichuanensis]|uniref:hypothetical protein n=1 Tax=Catellatospora sichuanensis TaxID=1969805 RepID=UPI0016424C23|nr:hypothetical protein [Catellatospora sichuanensis]